MTYDFYNIVKYLNFKPVVEDLTVMDGKYENICPIRYIKHVGQEIVIPANSYFPIPNSTVPLIIGQFNYTAPSKFRIAKSGILFRWITTNIQTNFAICIRYRINNVVFRYLLAGILENTALVPYPIYTNQLIEPNFCIEIWSQNILHGGAIAQINVPVDISITTSNLRNPTTADDFKNDGIVYNFFADTTDLGYPIPESTPTNVNPAGPWNTN